MIRLTFHGAAREVTGSCFQIKTKDINFLVDCGYFQGSSALEDRNWDAFAFDPAKIEYVFLTHAHLDHCGQLPKLVRHGFRGKIFCTDATKDLAEIIMYDTVKIMKSKYERGRLKYSDGSPKNLLFRNVDVAETVRLIEPVPYTKGVELSKGLEFRMRNAGHILGSSIFEIWVPSNGVKRKFVFSGDLGQPGKRIIWDPDNVRHADYIIVESTYGDRLHKDHNESVLEFLSLLKNAEQRKGNILIPVFAIERTQEVVYELNLMVENGLLNNVPIYLDSPMAKKATEVFMKYEKYYDTDAIRLIEKGDDPFEFRGFRMIESVDESKALAQLCGGIILAGSGMCTGGRILHHLLNNIENTYTHIVFVGYQVRGTLGRRIIEGEKIVKIMGQKRKVKAQIHTIGGLSAHADQKDLRYWLRGFGTTPQKVFVVHGDEEVVKIFAGNIREALGLNVVIPSHGETIEIQ